MPEEMLQYRRTYSLTEHLEAASEATRNLEGALRQHDSKASKNEKSLRRCKSNPEKIPRKHRNEARPHAEWRRGWDKEKGYVTDLVAEPQPTTVQPQLSYFAYLGNNDPSKVRYQSLSITEDTQTVINLGNAIYFQNRPKVSPSGPAITLPEVMELQRNTVREPVKSGNTQLLECCTCMCCVKGLFYHCTKDRELEGNWAGEPCACEEPGIECAARWGIMGVLSLFMPCLLCYPVLNGCCKPCLHLRRTWEP